MYFNDIISPDYLKISFLRDKGTEPFLSDIKLKLDK